MGRSRSSSTESSGSTSSSSSSTYSSASDRHHKFNLEKKRTHRSEDNRNTSNVKSHDNVNNRRRRSRSNSRQRNSSDGRKNRNRDKSADRRRISNVSNERHRRNSGDSRRDKRRSNSIDKKRTHKRSSSDDRRRTRKRSSSDVRRRPRKRSASDERRRARKQSSSEERRRTRKRSSSDDKRLQRKRSSSNDKRSNRIRSRCVGSSRTRHRRIGSRNRNRSHSDDKRRERKHSSSVERNQDKKRSSSGQDRYGKENRSSDRKDEKRKRNSQSSDKSQNNHSRYRSGSEDGINNRKSRKRKSDDIKSRDESLNKKSKFDEQPKKDEGNNIKKSKEVNVIIPSIPCKWDRVDDTSRDGESDDLIKIDINKENHDQEANECIASISAKKCNDIKSEVLKKNYGDENIKDKIVVEDNTHSPNKEKSKIKDAIVERNKLTISEAKAEVNTKEEVGIKKSVTKDPISFSIKSIRKEHKKKHVGKESKNKLKEEIFQSGYETDSESESKEENSSKHHKRSKKKANSAIKSIDSNKIMSESEDELQKMKAQLQKELEMEEELERQEKIKIDDKGKSDDAQNLKKSLKIEKSENLKTKSKENMDDFKTSTKSDKSLEVKRKSHSEKKEKLSVTSEIAKENENIESNLLKDSKILLKDCKEKKTDHLKSSTTYKEEVKHGSIKDSADKKKESSLSHEDVNVCHDKKKEITKKRKEDNSIISSGIKFDDSFSNLEDIRKASSPNVGDKRQEELKSQKESKVECTNSSSRHEDNGTELGSPAQLHNIENSDKLKSSSWSGHGTEPLLNELPTHNSRQTKTSDTYWNKYADKFGIIIDDPKYLENDNGNVNKKRKLSPSDNRKNKSGNEETMNNVPGSDKLGSDATNSSQSEKKALATPSLKKPVLDPISSKTGGAYIPPARLKMMQDQITDKSSAAYQRLAWEALKKSINGLVNKVNVSNIGIIVRELFKENIVRGRGLLCRAIMQAQAFSLTFTHVYAAMVAVINTKFPQIGELLLHRLVLQLRRGVKRNDKNSCMASCRFIGHLINQQVAHEVVALEILTMLLEKAKDLTDESEVGDKSRKASVELAIAFLKECGMKLSELTPKGLMIVMETLRNILHEGKLDSRFQYMVEVLMAIKKGGFKDYPAVIEELDLVEEEDQFTHVIELDGKLDTQEMLNVFKLDPDYEENESKYKELKASILGDDSDESGGEGSSESGAESDDEESEVEKGDDGNIILDRSETNLVAFRRTVYLTIQSSLDVDECAHKLLKGEIKPGWEEELCNMIIDCCAQQRTYMKFYGLLAQRFCMLNKVYQQYFEKIFKDAYETCHRLEIEKLRNVAKLFSHLFFSDAISWESFSCIHLNQDETTSSSRVFLKIFFEDLGDFMGLCKLNERLRDQTLASSYEGLLPRDNPVNTRFAINFFTTIGLGGLTDDLREFLRSQPKPTAVVAPVPQTPKDGSSDSSSSSSDSSSDESSSSSDSSSESSSTEDSSSDSSSSDSSSSESSLSDSSHSDSSSSENSSSDDSRKKPSTWKNKKKLLKKLQMEQRRALKKIVTSNEKKKSKEEKYAKAESSRTLIHKNVDEGKSKKISRSERNNLVFENKKVAERNSERQINKSNRNDSSDESSSEDTRARKVGESSKNNRSRTEQNNVSNKKQQERYKEINSKRRKADYSSDREERIRNRHCSREKTNETQEKSRRNKDENGSQNNNNSKEEQLEGELRSMMSERSDSSKREEKQSKKPKSKEVETEKNKNKREHYHKEERKDKRKDLKNDERKKEKRREKENSEIEEESESHRRRRNKEKDNNEYESKSKGSRDKDREKKDERRSRRLSQV